MARHTGDVFQYSVGTPSSPPPPFVSLQLSVSGLSVCCVYLVLSFLYSPPIPPFHVFPALLFFHSVSCHCLSALSHSQHSSLSPSLASFFLSLLTGAFLLFHSLQLHLLVFSSDLYPPILFVILFFFFLSFPPSSFPLPFSLSLLSLSILPSVIFIMRKAAGES